MANEVERREKKEKKMKNCKAKTLSHSLSSSISISNLSVFFLSYTEKYLTPERCAFFFHKYYFMQKKGRVRAFLLFNIIDKSQVFKKCSTAIGSALTQRAHTNTHKCLSTMMVMMMTMACLGPSTKLKRDESEKKLICKHRKTERTE